MKSKIGILAFGLLCFSNLTFAAIVKLNCHWTYAGKNFHKLFTLGNQRDPVTGGMTAFPSYPLAEENHYCGGSTSYFNLSQQNKLQLTVRSSQGCSYTSSDFSTLKEFSLNDKISFQDQTGDDNTAVLCSIQRLK